jgi:hypothetical protein
MEFALGSSPNEAFWVEVVDEPVAEFQGKRNGARNSKGM